MSGSSPCSVVAGRVLVRKCTWFWFPVQHVSKSCWLTINFLRRYAVFVCSHPFTKEIWPCCSRFLWGLNRAALALACDYMSFYLLVRSQGCAILVETEEKRKKREKKEWAIFLARDRAPPRVLLLQPVCSMCDALAVRCDIRDVFETEMTWYSWVWNSNWNPMMRTSIFPSFIDVIGTLRLWVALRSVCV